MIAVKHNTLRMKRPLLFCFMIVLLYFILLPNITFAEISTKNILNSVLEKYHSAATSWANIIQERAEWLFGILAIISFSWQMAQAVNRHFSLTEILGELIRSIIFFGFYFWLLQDGPHLATAIIDSLRMIGAQAAGVDKNFYPSDLVDIGFIIYDIAQANLDIWSVTSMAAYIISLIVLVIFALIGINMLLQLCSAWVLAYAGIFFLGFGGSKWTSDMAVNYFKTVLGLGASLMTMTLLIGIGTSIVTESIGQMDTSGAQNLTEMAVLLITSITLFMLVDKLPSMVAGIINGAGVGSTGIGAFGAGAAMGTAATAMGVAAASISHSVSTLVKTATGGAGLVSAYKASKENLIAGNVEGFNKNYQEGGLSAALGFVKPPSATAVVGKMAGSAIKSSFNKAKENSFGGKLAETISGKDKKETDDAQDKKKS